MVKRILAIILCIPVFLALFACNKKSGTAAPPAALPNAFSTKAWVKTEQIEVTCTLERKMAGVYTAVVGSPQEIKGLTFQLEGEVLNITYEGKSFDMPATQLPETSFFALLVSALDASMRVEALTAQRQESKWLVKGTCSKGEFKMTQEDNCLQALQITNVLQATFTEFQPEKE